MKAVSYPNCAYMSQDSHGAANLYEQRNEKRVLSTV